MHGRWETSISHHFCFKKEADAKEALACELRDTVRLVMSWRKMSSSGTHPESFRKTKTDMKPHKENGQDSIIPRRQASNLADSSNETDT